MLAWLLDRPGSVIDVAMRGLAFGVGANVVALRFVPAVIARFTPLPWVAGAVALGLLAAAQGLAWVVAAIARMQLVRAGVPRWGAFAVGVYLAAFVPAIFPWTPAGGLTRWPSLVQLADLVGERGVSALLALGAGLLAEGARTRRLLPAVAAAALTASMAGYGAWRIERVEALRAHAPTAKVALVQPSIGATFRWDAANAPGIVAKLTALTQAAERRGADLTVWTEAAYPWVLDHASRRAPLGGYAILQAGVRGPVLTGALLRGAPGDAYNSAVIAFADGALSPPYDKLHLLWFGESVPLAAQLPWLRRTFFRGVGLVPGEASTRLDAGPIHAGILICFEDTLPEAGREAAKAAPNLLVNLSNDAWFEGSQESELHLRIAALRAVEARRDLVRAVNFGPTSWVDAAGIVRARYASDLPGSLLAEPALLETPLTVYTRAGDLPLLAALTIACTAAIFRHRRARVAAAR